MGQQTTGFENNRMYESERTSIKLTHNDFAADQDFDYLQENDALQDFLLEKNWDDFFTQAGPYAIRRCDTSVANKIFKAVHEKFKFRMDTVQMFHIITDFYDIKPAWYFERLVQNYRKILQTDLEHRIGKLRNTTKTKIGEDKIRLTFASLFSS